MNTSYFDAFLQTHTYAQCPLAYPDLKARKQSNLSHPAVTVLNYVECRHVCHLDASEIRDEYSVTPYQINDKARKSNAGRKPKFVPPLIHPSDCSKYEVVQSMQEICGNCSSENFCLEEHLCYDCGFIQANIQTFGDGYEDDRSTFIESPQWESKKRKRESEDTSKLKSVYDHEVHFANWLMCAQGIESVKLPNFEILDSIEVSCNQNPNITCDEVLQVLKKMKLCSMYPHAFKIWLYVTKTDPSKYKLTPEETKLILGQQMELMDAWHELYHDKNVYMFSYRSQLRFLCVYNGWFDKFNHCPKIKDRYKLNENLRVWNNCCEYNGVDVGQAIFLCAVRKKNNCYHGEKT